MNAAAKLTIARATVGVVTATGLGLAVGNQVNKDGVTSIGEALKDRGTGMAISAIGGGLTLLISSKLALARAGVMGAILTTGGAAYAGLGVGGLTGAIVGAKI